MKCQRCGRKFRDGEDVIPVLRYVTNEKRGDFVTSQGHSFFHARHINEIPVIGRTD